VDFYPWIVFVHVAAAFVFVFAHGVSAFATYRIRAERNPERIRALLDVSTSGIQAMYGALGLLLIAGIAGGIVGGWFGRGWIWAAIGVLVVVMFAMYGLALPYYRNVRMAVGLPASSSRNDNPAPQPATPQELDALLDSRRPDLIAGLGFIGLLLIIWLMVVKPF
jgi:hypothetical protein